MDDVQGWMESAIRHHESGDLAQAGPLYKRVLRIDPQHFSAMYHLGTLEIQQANLPAAVDLLKQAALVRPQLVEIHVNLGIAYKGLGDWNAAAQAFEQALAIDPQSASAYFNMGTLAEQLGQADAAVACYRQAIAIEPSIPEHYARLAEILFKHGNWLGAEQCYTEALKIDSPYLDRDTILNLQSGLGMAQLRQEKLDDAVRTFQKMLDTEPNFAEIHNNLAFVFERQGKLAQALEAARRAVQIKPQYADGYNNMGVAFRGLHRLDEARQAFHLASELNPANALFRFNEATVQLTTGDYPGGWPGYEARIPLLPPPARTFDAPRWQGQSLPGGTLLIHAEQGYGDTIQFARFIARAKEASAARIVLEAPASLIALLEHVEGVDVCLRIGTPLPAVDAEVPLPSLPGVLGVGLADLPGKTPYLSADPQRRARWRERLQEKSRISSTTSTASVTPAMKVGIVWQGNPDQAQNHTRSCSLAHFSRLASLTDIRWFSLQKGAAAEAELSQAHDVPVTPLGNYLADFSDTAAVLCELDLLITVDTSVAHLAGALGIPAFVLLCHTPDWRWMLDRDDCPWYPTLRLFRQPAWGDWTSVFDQVANALARRVE